MLLLQPDVTTLAPPPGMVAVFGVGLVGSSVADAVRLLGNWRREFVPLSWDDSVSQPMQLEVVFDRIRQFVGAASEADSPPRLQIVWSAGRAGFGSTEHETARELQNFQAVITAVRELSESFPRVPMTVHHVSSVGGLFEGQRSIQRKSSPSVRRPYGSLKLQQERELDRLSSRVVRRIYRLTSVIGPATGRHRRGLIGTLIDDGLHHRTTRLVGLPTTLRDYVWHKDVGRYIAESILMEERAAVPCTCILASAKPSTIHEVIEVIESIFHRRLYTQRAAVTTNDADMTVTRETLPPDWHPTDLLTCVSQVYRDALAFPNGLPQQDARPLAKVKE